MRDANWGSKREINRDVKEAIVEALGKMTKSMEVLQNTCLGL